LSPTQTSEQSSPYLPSYLELPPKVLDSLVLMNKDSDTCKGGKLSEREKQQDNQKSFFLNKINYDREVEKIIRTI
jgi:hypothetical protein